MNMVLGTGKKLFTCAIYLEIVQSQIDNFYIYYIAKSMGTKGILHLLRL